MCERSLKDRTASRRILDAKSNSTACLCYFAEINRIQIAFIFRIAQKHHLLPFDLAQRIVLDHNYLDRELVFDRSSKLTHEHGKPPVTNESYTLPIGVGDLSRDRVRQPVRHARECA